MEPSHLLRKQSKDCLAQSHPPPVRRQELRQRLWTQMRRKQRAILCCIAYASHSVSSRAFSSLFYGFYCTYSRCSIPTITGISSQNELGKSQRPRRFRCALHRTSPVGEEPRFSQRSP
ncbi:hypothetical protein EVAR_34099_1 [Eumeta japonica]|uniref:Uncharacterized protein n=1 Tax=Eumeta variegata TaxID=151549 RepID=A0A4C1WJW6_EUMVA|nr:hypothetical protein EVAR_34099_1 [Eumeta japonica]